MKTTITMRRGFRPLTGIMVLIEREKKIAWYENYAFPSPYGDYGSYLTVDLAARRVGKA